MIINNLNILFLLKSYLEKIADKIGEINIAESGNNNGMLKEIFVK